MTIHDADSHSSPGGGMSTASSFGHGIRSSPADTTPVESTILASLPPPALCGLAPRSSRAGPQGRSHPVPRADTEPGEPVPPSNQRGIILKQRQHVGEGTAAARSDKSIVVRSDGPGSHETLPAQRPPAARQPLSIKWQLRESAGPGGAPGPRRPGLSEKEEADGGSPERTATAEGGPRAATRGENLEGEWGSAPVQRRIGCAPNGGERENWWIWWPRGDHVMCRAGPWFGALLHCMDGGGGGRGAVAVARDAVKYSVAVLSAGWACRAAQWQVPATARVAPPSLPWVLARGTIDHVHQHHEFPGALLISTTLLQYFRPVVQQSSASILYTNMCTPHH
ncbi:hypothetical protein Purlil1_8451 [Purpureocillium lilacinum]|uniref:Uncharacterized protein n=1 Tax=Purpureocillium lilacinum TaxID=33203 RepID=A0ABR0BUL7_PURLI|nr:hypothetical protein Purlil1_8451 [Purpureocillium lilacinum]